MFVCTCFSNQRRPACAKSMNKAFDPPPPPFAMNFLLLATLNFMDSP